MDEHNHSNSNSSTLKKSNTANL